MKKYFITDFGAVPGENNLQTDYIQAAIDECFKNGGGTVEIPSGLFLTGGIRLRSNVTLHLASGAILKGSRNPEDYFGYLNDTLEPLDNSLITNAPWDWVGNSSDDEAYTFFRTAGSRWNNGLIRAINAENIAITGEVNSVIDGSDCFDELGEEHYRGPHCISIFYCKSITFSGYTVKDSANWSHSVFYSENVCMDNVTVEAGHDGIHMTASKNITVKNSNFYTGDDCIAGTANVNVYVNNCELNSACSAFRFGGTNLFAENCHIYGPCRYIFRGSMTDEEKRSGAKPKKEGHRTNMLSAFTYYADFSVPIDVQPGNIVFKNCTVENADRFIHYNFSGNEPWQQNRPLESLKFEDVRVENMSYPICIYGAKEIPVCLEIKNSVISVSQGFENNCLIHTAFYDRIKIDGLRVENFNGDSLIKKWEECDGCIDIKNLEGAVSSEKYLKKAEKPFECQAI